MRIRCEGQKDWLAVHALNVSAFGDAIEANLVHALREHAHPVISLVAEQKGSIVGHIMFSPVTLDGHAELKIMGLGPMAVVPAEQRQGIGSSLVRAGLDQCKQLGFGAVVVVGHPSYYPRFGFAPSAHYYLACQYEVPDEAFMALELEPGYLRGLRGIVKYHRAFDEAANRRP